MKKLGVIIFGIVFMAVGAFVFINGQMKEKNCTIEAVATVVEINEDTSLDEDGDFTYTYYPVLEYVAGENIVRKQSTNGSSIPKYKINDKVNILYNQNKVEEFIIKGDKSSNIFGIAFMIIGAVVCVCGIVKRF